jgi:hypothetical protein
MRMLTSVAVLSLLVGIVACGGDSSPTVTPTPAPTPPPRAIILVLIDPNPIVAVPSGNADFPWDFRFNLQLSDSGGVSFVVTSMQTTVTSAISGLTLHSTDQNPFVGVEVPAFGQETRQFHLGAYRMENMTKEGTVTLQLNFVDGNGNASAQTTSVEVRLHGGPVRLD